MKIRSNQGEPNRTSLTFESPVEAKYAHRFKGIFARFMHYSSVVNFDTGTSRNFQPEASPEEIEESFEPFTLDVSKWRMLRVAGSIVKSAERRSYHPERIDHDALDIARAVYTHFVGETGTAQIIRPPEQTRPNLSVVELEYSR
jgi:hypothetical protein